MTRLADPATWPAELGAVAGDAQRTALPGGAHWMPERTVYFLGNAAARERFWIQLDAVADLSAAAAACRAVLEALTGTGVSKYRHLVLARSSLAVVTPGLGHRRQAGDAAVPVLDAGTMGATPAILDAMARFAPTFVVHLQDWAEIGSLEIDGGESARAGGAGASRDAGVRLVESFPLAPDVHGQLTGHRALRTWLRRPSRLARTLRDHPDARVGAAVRRYTARMGCAVARSGSPDPAGPFQAVVSLGEGRYAPRMEWRRLGGGNLAELALAHFGSAGITAQIPGGRPAARAAGALAVTEGCLLYRLGLEVPEGGR